MFMGPEQSASDSPLALWPVYPCAKWTSLLSLPCWLQHISFFFMNMFPYHFYSLTCALFQLTILQPVLASRVPLLWLTPILSRWLFMLSVFAALLHSIGVAQPVPLPHCQWQESSTMKQPECCTARYPGTSAELISSWWFCHLSAPCCLQHTENFTF